MDVFSLAVIVNARWLHIKMQLNSGSKDDKNT